MNLNLFENIKLDLGESIKNFMAELSNALENRKEGHLYLVTEDRNGEVYLWDFTDKPKKEFREKYLPKEILEVAKEGTMLIYEKGKYRLYSEDGYDMLYDESIKNKNNY